MPDPTPPAVLDGGPLLPEPHPATLPDALIRAASLPGAGRIVYLDGEGRPAEQGYADLLADARLILGGIRASEAGAPISGPRPTDRVLLQIRAEPDLLAAFWACVLGGFVPVPVTAAPPPGSALTAPELLEGLWTLLGGAWIVSDDPAGPASACAQSRLGDVAFLRAAGGDDPVPAHAAAPGDVAALLLTSGSTGLPKAVALTHRNIIARAAASARVRGLSSRNRTFNWMPLDHVGGLIMFHARDVWLGCHQVHARTGWVLADPLRWPAAISEHRCDTTWAPNFAFGLVVDKAAEAAGRSWDLSRLTYIMNGGEAVKPHIARGFLDLLAPYGVPRTAMHPGWGMSETSGGVVDCVFDPALAAGGRFVPVGVPHPGVTVRVVAADGTAAPQGTAGRLQARGLPITVGYAGDEAQNRQSFTPDGWFKTGDLAVIENGTLTVAGRVDDAIEIGSVTYYGHEIESAIEALGFAEPSYTVVCPLEEGTELAVFYHPRSGAGSDAEGWQVVEHVARRFGLRVAVVRPVRREDVPKTGIGKLKRAQLLELLEPATRGALTDNPGRLTSITVTCMTDLASPPAGAAAAPAPNDLLTGDSYLESLRDGRAVHLYGERVADVTAHPAFKNAARSTAHLYDMLHAPETADTMTTLDRYTGARVHRFFTPAHSSEDLLKARDAIELWARSSYGFMNRTPDYKASFMAGLAVTHEYYEPFADSAFGWYSKYARQGLAISHAIVNPPVDRHKPTHEVSDVYVKVVGERDGGIIVDGAKLMATASALTHAAFVGQIHLANLEKGKAEDYALAFMAPLDTPGLKVICRPSYEQKANSPFDNPLSARFDENDAVLVFDNAFIPWENVLIYRDVDKVHEYFPRSGLLSRGFFQGAIRMAVKLEFMVGLMDKGTRLNGTDQFRGVRAGLGELLAWRHVTWGITTAMAMDPEPGPGGCMLPKMSYAAGYRALAPLSWERTHRMFEEHLAASLLMTPAGNLDLTDPELRKLLDRYYRGSAGTAEERIKLFKLAWDALGSEFGGRHELYELNYAGSVDQVRLDTLAWSQAAGILGSYSDFVETCMSDYDVSGWTRGRWSDPS